MTNLIALKIRTLRLLLALSVCASVALVGDTLLARDLPNSIHDKLVTLQAALPEQNHVAIILEQLGFPPPNAPETWRQWQKWPAERQLEVAYVSAESARPGKGGSAMIQKLSRLMAANHYDSIRYEPSLAGFFHETQEAPVLEKTEVLSFAIPSSGGPKVSLPDNVRMMIKTVCKYAEPFPTEYLFAECCTLTSSETSQILSTESSYESAFEKAVSLHGQPPPYAAKVARLVEAVRVDNPAIEFEPSLIETLHPVSLPIHESVPLPLRVAGEQVSAGIHKNMSPVLASTKEPNRPQDPLHLGSSSSAGQMGGGLPNLTGEQSNRGSDVARNASSSTVDSRAPGNQTAPESGSGSLSSIPSTETAATEGLVSDTYRVFEDTTYRVAENEAVNFAAMAGEAIGFGGVIFGNTVSVTPELSAPKSGPLEVWWKDAALATSHIEEPWGRLVFRFKGPNGDKTLYTHLLRADTVFSAKAITIDDKVSSPTAGYGLVGLKFKFVPAKLNQDNEIVPYGQGYSYVINPKIADTRLGRSMILLDTLPQVLNSLPKYSDTFSKLIEQSGASKGDIARFKTIFLGGTDLGQYKFTDVKLQVYSKGETICVRRRPGDGPLATSDVRSEAYITLLPFKGDKPGPELISAYLLIPTLTRISDTFSRANEAAEVFALLRWAKFSGAKWVGPDPLKASLSPATAVVADDDGSFTFGPSAAAFDQALNLAVSERARKISSTSNSAALKAKTDDLETKFTNYIVSRSAAQLLDSPARTVALALSADKDLRKEFPGAHTKTQVLISFNEDLDPELKDKAHDWIDSHKQALEKAIPGLKERWDLNEQILGQEKGLENALDQQAVFNELTGNSHAAELERLIAAEESTDDDKEEAQAESQLNALLQSTPGFTSWFEVESELFNWLTGG